MKTLVALILIVAAPSYAVAQQLEADPARDRPFHNAIRAFLDGAMPLEQFEAELRDYARGFETAPYKVDVAKIDWGKVPQDRMVAVARAMSRITNPVLEAYFKGEVSASEAAKKTAPFFLVWPGYGMDPPAADSISRQRTDDLLAGIAQYRTTADDFRFGYVAEGYASTDETTGVNVAPRMFSVPDNICASAPQPATLETPQDGIDLLAGQPYAITRIVAVARDAAGALLRGVPIAIEVELIEPRLLNQRSDATPENHLHPLRPGNFQLRVRTICGDKPVQVFIPAIVH
jgi:hypothetical protein